MECLMVKTLLLLFGLALALEGATGTVVVTPPAPGKFVATAGNVTCTVSGNAIPATAVQINCVADGTVTLQNSTIPLPAGAGYTMSHSWGVVPAQGSTPGQAGDAVTATFLSSSSGVISYQVVATPNGGTPSPVTTGSF
jgi:hypothetical protein